VITGQKENQVCGAMLYNLHPLFFSFFAAFLLFVLLFIFYFLIKKMMLK